MKLIESTIFEALNSALSLETRLYRISTRIENYSCKMAGNEKAMYKRFTIEQGKSPTDLQALSPPISSSPQVSFFGAPSTSSDEDGPLCDTISRKTLFYLIATLNASFGPDYDFSNAKVSLFSK